MKKTVGKLRESCEVVLSKMHEAYGREMGLNRVKEFVSEGRDEILESYRLSAVPD